MQIRELGRKGVQLVWKARHWSATWVALFALALTSFIPQLRNVLMPRANPFDGELVRVIAFYSVYGLFIVLWLLCALLVIPRHIERIESLRVVQPLRRLSDRWVGAILAHLPSDTHDALRLAANLALRLAAVVAVQYALGELIWRITPLTDFVSYRVYSIWGMLVVLLGVLTAGLLCDTAFRSARNKLIALAGVALGVISIISLTNYHDRIDALTEGPEDPGNAWFTQIDQRIAQMPESDHPVLLVAAAGGGSRAAIFGSLVFETLQHEGLSDYVLFVSSVSGGSVASANYAHRDAHVGASAHATDKTRFKNAFIGQIRKELKRQQGDAGSWALRSAEIDDMFADFNAPLVRGILLPGLSRGDSVAMFWRRHFGWTCDGKSFRRVPPLLLINAADSKTGERYVFGEPPMPVGLLGGFESYHSLTDQDPSARLALQDAVRASATFPWGMDIPVVRTHAGAVPVIDGGVFDNTGLDTLSVLLERLREVAAGEVLPAQQARARTLLRELRRRGVVVVEVDSGAKPADPGWQTLPFQSVLEPLEAMKKANYSQSLQNKNLHLKRIDEVLTDTHLARNPFPVPGRRTLPVVTTIRAEHVAFAYRPEGSGVMTAWGLGPKDKASVIKYFQNEEAAKIATLQGRIRNLAKAESHDQTPFARQLTQDLYDARQQTIQPPEVPSTRSTSSWVYLGQFDRGSGTWNTRYFEIPLDQRPDTLRGTRLTSSGALHLRNAMPTDEGAFGEVTGRIEGHTPVHVEDVGEWRDSGFMWARVRVES